MNRDSPPRRSLPATSRASSTAPSGDSEVVRAKFAVAAAIDAALARRGLTMRAAAGELRLDAADVQRIRNGDVVRFTLDRLLRVALRLGHTLDLRVAPPSAKPDA